MTEPEATEASEPAASVEPGELGRLLQGAREARELSIEDLAHMLRLEPRIVRALESEDFERLPPPAFVRGYLRAIAKEYGMDSATFLAVFDQRAGNEEPELSDFKSRAPLQMTSESNLVRYTTAVVVLVLVVLVALWWRAHDAVPRDHEPLVETPPPAEPADPLPYEFPVVTHPESVLPPTEGVTPAPRSAIGGPEAALDAPGAAMLAPGSEGAVVNEGGSRGRAPADDIPGEGDVPSDTAAETAGRAGETGAADDAMSVNAAEAAPDGTPATPGELVINTSEEAWIDVSDASGRRLFFDIARPGRELTFDGTPPYTLVLGNSPAVDVRFRGTTVDLAPHAHEGVARLTLGR